MILSSICFVLIMYLGFKRAPGPSTFGLIWWTVFTLPVLGFVNLGPLTAASRYAYIPSVGLCLAVGGIAASLPGRVVYSRLFTGSVVAAAAALGLSASVQAGIWKSDITLFREITRSNPGFAVAHVNMGSALAREGMFDEALLSYSRAEALVPGWADVGYNRGNPLFRVGKYEAALRDYDAVLKQEPEDWEAYLNRGNALSALGRLDEAQVSYRQAAKRSSSSCKPLAGLGVLAGRQGDPGRAVEYFAEAVRREPGLPEAHEGLGKSYGALGMAEGAFRKALVISPGSAGVSVKPGLLLLGAARPMEAQRAFGAALKVEPGNHEAWLGLVRAMDIDGQRSEADDLIRGLESVDPGLAGRLRDLRSARTSVVPGR